MEGPGRQFETPEEEIAFLREALRDKQSQREAIPQASFEAPHKPEAEDVVREFVQAPAQATSPEQEAVVSEAERIVLDLTPETHDKTVEEFLRLALEKGVKHTLLAVQKLGNPHLEDDFHRMLAEYVKEERMPRGTSPKMTRALSFSLFEVRVPRAETESSEREAFRSTISQMEKLFAGLRHLSNEHSLASFSIELAIEHVGSDVKLFIAIERDKRELFEKQLSALFPRTRLSLVNDDYNIFNDSGESSASVASLSKHGAYPIHTYDTFSGDPLNTLVQALTELKHEGEGAAIQFVFSPLPEKHASYFQSLRDKIKRGEDPKEVLSTRPELARELSSFIFGGKSKEQSESERQENATKNQHIADLLSEKTTAGLYGASVRIVTSAEDKSRADALLHTVESAFRQFDRPEGNSLEFKAQYGRALQKTLQRFSFRLYNESEAMPLNYKECATLVHIPGPGTHSIATAAPSGQFEGAPPSDLASEGLLLGANEYRGRTREVYISPDDRLRHFYCIGQTGTGKSTLLKNMVIQDILAGEGVCMIDPHGSDIDDILAAVPPERFDDVIYFDPADTSAPMGLNMLEFDRRFPEQKTFVVNEMLSIFNKLFDMKTAGGPMFEQYFRNSVLLALEGDEPATLLDVSRVLADSDYRARKLAQSTNPVIVQFWQEVAGKAGGDASLKNIVPYITSKFDVFLTNDVMRPIIAQPQSAFNFRDVMDNKKILLVNLSKGRLGDINANLIGLIIVGKLLLAALSRVELRGTDFPPFYLYLDEFQNVTTDSIAVILSEARKYKLALHLAHQFIAQISDPIKNAVFGNVGSLASFRVGQDDAEYLERTFAPVFSARDIANIENRHAILKLLVHGTPREAFQVTTMPPIEGDEHNVAGLKQLSRDKFGGDKAEIERRIIEGYRKS